MEFSAAIKMNEMSVHDMKALLDLQDILINKKEQSIESCIQYNPFLLDGNSKLLMMFTTGKRGL